MDVSIIFVNYKTSGLVHDAIRSVKEHSSDFSYEIIVVDNSESEEEYNKLKDLESADVHLIDAKSNLGFGKANNLGATIAKGNYLFFLNTDTLLMNNAIDELKRFLDCHEDVGIVGSNLYTKDEIPNHSFCPWEKNVHNENKMSGFFTLLKKYTTGRRPDYNYTNQPKRIDGYICGAALMIRKSLFDNLGGFDKEIFMYAEESLLCYRAIHEKGFRIYNVPSSKIIHFEGGSFDNSVSYRKIRMIIDGNYIYYKKAFGDKISKKYLKKQLKVYRLKKIISKIIRRDKYKIFQTHEKAYQDKLNEVNSK